METDRKWKWPYATARQSTKSLPHHHKTTACRARSLKASSVNHINPSIRITLPYCQIILLHREYPCSWSSRCSLFLVLEVSVLLTGLLRHIRIWTFKLFAIEHANLLVKSALIPLTWSFVSVEMIMYTVIRANHIFVFQAFPIGACLSICSIIIDWIN